MMNVMSKTTEVSSKARRRRFTTAEKLRILREADAGAGEKGAVAALLRREGLYSSHLSTWRAQRDMGQFGSSPRKRGPVPVARDARDQQIVDLERRALRAEARADRAERLVELQKKLSLLLEIPLPEPESEPRR